MKKAAAHSTTLQTERSSVSSTSLHPGPMVLDTAWRIVLPVTSMSILGVVADSILDSGPWLGLLGLMIGFVFASVLVKHQAGDDGHAEK